MNNRVKDLFSLKNDHKAEVKEQSSSEHQLYDKEEEEIKISSRKLGYQEASKVLGQPAALHSHLDALYQRHVKEVQSQQEKQELAKKPHVEKRDRLKNEKDGAEANKERLNERIDRYKNQISELKEEIRKIKENPKEYLGSVIDPNARVSFIIGLFIILFLTVYLILFYSSASYSAFFRQIQADMEVTQTIFDSKAFIKAYNTSFFTLILISTIPFVFLALGYLIHKFQENKQDYWRYFKVGMLVITTFLFDALLAYQIDDKLYGATKTINDPAFNVELALVSPDFWIIIFAGFVVYLIWGLVFDFTISEYRNINAINRATLKREDNIKELKEKIERDEKERDDFNVEIKKLNSQLEREQAIIDNNYFSFPREYQLIHMHYMKGWVGWMVGNECSDAEIQNANSICDKKLEDFFEPINKAKRERDVNS